MTSWTHLASDWLTVSTGDDPSINIYEMRFSNGEINDYYSIYTMTTSPYTLRLYIQLLAYVAMPKQVIVIQLQYFRAKFFHNLEQCNGSCIGLFH